MGIMSLTPNIVVKAENGDDASDYEFNEEIPANLFVKGTSYDNIKNIISEGHATSLRTLLDYKCVFYYNGMYYIYNDDFYSSNSGEDDTIRGALSLSDTSLVNLLNNDKVLSSKFNIISEDWFNSNGLELDTVILYFFDENNNPLFTIPLKDIDKYAQDLQPDDNNTGGGNTTTTPDDNNTGGGSTTNDNNTGGNNTTTPPTGNDGQTGGSDNQPSLPEVGTKKTVSNGVYQVTKSSATSKEVTYAKPKDSKKASVTIPDTIKIDGQTYKVTEVAAKAFKNNKKIKTVTIGKNIKKIGKEAFSGCKKLNKIVIKGSGLKNVGKNAIKGINAKATIKCPKKQLSAYKKLFKSNTGYKKTMKIKK